MARHRGFHGQARRRLPFDTPLEVATPGARLPQELLQSLALTSAAPIPRSRPVTLSVPLCSTSVLSCTDIFPDLLATDIILNHRHADILTSYLVLNIISGILKLKTRGVLWTLHCIVVASASGGSGSHPHSQVGDRAPTLWSHFRCNDILWGDVGRGPGW